MADPEEALPHRTGFGAKRLAGLYVAFAALAFAVYGPALRGELLSDDVGYIATNPYLHELTLENLWVVLDPWGDAANFTANYAPVHLLLLALEWRWFGMETPGYHAVNVLAHALASLLLVPLFTRAGISRGIALLGALLFLLHPANAEAVAWISQSKTILCLLLAAGALLLHPRHPAAALALFTLSLLSKATAAFALPVAAWFGWRRAATEPPRWGWLAGWALCFGLYLVPQLLAFKHSGELTPPGVPAGAFETLRTMAAIGARYLVMAATSYGVSTFHQPPAARALLDGWWLAGLALGAALGLRLLWTAWRGREEAGFWLWAAAAYAPVCQIFPFLYPMADRYLYTILPGLIGAASLAANGLGRPREGAARGATGRTLTSVGWVLACALLALLALRSHERAAVFRTNRALMLDSARNYPEGLSASLIRARGAAQRGDAAGTAEALLRAAELGFDSFFAIDTGIGLEQVRQDPRVRAAIGEIAGRWIETARARGYSVPRELQIWAQAHAARGEWAEAADVLERALAQPGRHQPEIRKSLAEARRRLAEGREAGPSPPGGAPHSTR